MKISKALSTKTINLIEGYIDQYVAVHKAEYTTEEILEQLRSWSNLKNGMSVYINSADLMPEFRLVDGGYCSIKLLGIEINVNNGKVGSVSLELKDGDEYGLPDLEALVDYATKNIAEDKLEKTLKDFYVENTVEIDGKDKVAISSVKENEKLRTKAEILDNLLNREVSFGGGK